MQQFTFPNLQDVICVIQNNNKQKKTETIFKKLANKQVTTRKNFQLAYKLSLV